MVWHCHLSPLAEEKCRRQYINSLSTKTNRTKSEILKTITRFSTRSQLCLYHFVLTTEILLAVFPLRCFPHKLSFIVCSAITKGIWHRQMSLLKIDQGILRSWHRTMLKSFVIGGLYGISWLQQAQIELIHADMQGPVSHMVSRKWPLWTHEVPIWHRLWMSHMCLSVPRLCQTQIVYHRPALRWIPIPPNINLYLLIQWKKNYFWTTQNYLYESSRAEGKGNMKFIICRNR